jgi:hypothetical protein
MFRGFSLSVVKLFDRKITDRKILKRGRIESVSNPSGDFEVSVDSAAIPQSVAMEQVHIIRNIFPVITAAGRGIDVGSVVGRKNQGRP